MNESLEKSKTKKAPAQNLDLNRESRGGFLFLRSSIAGTPTSGRKARMRYDRLRQRQLNVLFQQLFLDNSKKEIPSKLYLFATTLEEIRFCNYIIKSSISVLEKNDDSESLTIVLPFPGWKNYIKSIDEAKQINMLAEHLSYNGTHIRRRYLMSSKRFQEQTHSLSSAQVSEIYPLVLAEACEVYPDDIDTYTLILFGVINSNISKKVNKIISKISHGCSFNIINIHLGELKIYDPSFFRRNDR